MVIDGGARRSRDDAKAGRDGPSSERQKKSKPVLTGVKAPDYISAINDGVAATT
jgi:hypothetical protein